jgi:predicted MFS family arabinose efflux permease
VSDYIPMHQIFTFISVLGNIGSAQAKTYAGMIVSRCFVGIGSSVALAIGGATVGFASCILRIFAN